MSGFITFYTAFLDAFADFLWTDSMKWIVALCIMYGVAVFIKKLVK